MFGLGAMEIAVILLLALIVLGPEKLPEVARKMARFTGELRRVSDEVRRNFDEASRDMENLRNPMAEPPKPRPAPAQSIAQGGAATGDAPKAVDPHANCEHDGHGPNSHPSSHSAPVAKQAQTVPGAAQTNTQAAPLGHVSHPAQPMAGDTAATPLASATGDKPKGDADA